MKFESLDLRGAVPQVVGPPREVNKLELARVVEHHRRWVESKGLHGRRADLTRAELEGTCLSGTSINLQDAVLHGVNLRRADLSMSDLRQACLAGADLREANLLGAKLRGADLQGATLEGAAHLWAEQLAGTNLAAATLDPTFRFEALATVAEVSRRARRLWLFLLLACLATVWVVLSSTDAQLLVGSVSPLPLLGRFFPLVEFHLLTPLLLLGLYVYLQLSVQRMWEGLGTLPAIFPDGDPVDAKAHPWLLTGLARTYSPWLQEKGAAPSALEQQVTLLLGYWVVPATLLLCWGRYLTRQDLHGSLLHVGLLAAAVAFALNLPALAERTLRLENRPPPRSERILRHARGTWRGVTVLSLAVLLAILSFGITYGAPAVPPILMPPMCVAGPPMPSGPWATVLLPFSPRWMYPASRTTGPEAKKTWPGWKAPASTRPACATPKPTAPSWSTPTCGKPISAAPTFPKPTSAAPTSARPTSGVLFSIALN
jgi:hypothetical protein